MRSGQLDLLQVAHKHLRGRGAFFFRHERRTTLDIEPAETCMALTILRTAFEEFLRDNFTGVGMPGRRQRTLEPVAEQAMRQHMTVE